MQVLLVLHFGEALFKEKKTKHKFKIKHRTLEAAMQVKALKLKFRHLHGRAASGQLLSWSKSKELCCRVVYTFHMYQVN